MADFNIGVEEEYQLIGAETGALRSLAGDVLATDWSAELTPEIQQSMLEIGTPICGSAAEVGRELRRLRLQAAAVAAAHDLRIVAAGLHPFSRWEAQRLSRGERYERLAERFGHVLRTEHVFGMHIHIGVPAGLDRIRCLNAVRPFLPHLIALSANSPFYEGADTGYASYRTILTGRLPHAGIPPRLHSDAEFAHLVQRLITAGVLEDASSLYWSVRPHPRYPTLEFRAMDVCLRVEDAVAMAALARALVWCAANERMPERREPLSPGAMDAILVSNEWQAARYGLEAVFADPSAPAGKVHARQALGVLIDQVADAATACGDGEALTGIATILRRGNGAQRTRARRPQCEDLRDLALWLARETLLGTGMDRRAEQRNAHG